MPTDDARTPGLPHVTHELRTRLAAATAAVEGLRDSTVAWTDDDRRELLSVAQSSLDQVRLLLSELSAAGTGLGLASTPGHRATPVPDILVAALADLGEGVLRPRTHLPAALPQVRGDPAVIRLLLVSVLRHTLRTTAGRRLDLRAVTRDDRVLLRVGGHAPLSGGWCRGHAPETGHVDRDTGLGPDVSIARDLAELLGGTLRAVGDESDGDQAVVLELPAAPRSGHPQRRISSS
jgi:two-component system sensor histidine kinase KdpD